jgi:Ca2+/Na+ antiporter
MVVIIGYNINVPDTVAGLTFLAAGSSLPEIVSSIIIARQGRAGMAISNSIGSNVFDILVCLGLPWFVQTAILRPMSEIHVFSGGIVYTVGLLLISIMILVLTFKLNKWHINKTLGIGLLFVWVLFTIISCLFEYDVFGKFSIPNC